MGTPRPAEGECGENERRCKVFYVLNKHKVIIYIIILPYIHIRKSMFVNMYYERELLSYPSLSHVQRAFFILTNERIEPMSEIKFSNESGGHMIDATTGQPVTWLSKNRVRFLEEGQDAEALAEMLVNIASEIKEWAGRLDAIHEHPDLQPFFRLSVSIGQPRPEQEKPSSSGSMSNMDLDDEEEEE